MGADLVIDGYFVESLNDFLMSEHTKGTKIRGLVTQACFSKLWGVNC